MMLDLDCEWETIIDDAGKYGKSRLYGSCLALFEGVQALFFGNPDWALRVRIIETDLQTLEAVWV